MTEAITEIDIPEFIKNPKTYIRLEENEYNKRIIRASKIGIRKGFEKGLIVGSAIGFILCAIIAILATVLV